MLSPWVFNWDEQRCTRAAVLCGEAGRVTGYFPIIGLFAFLCNCLVDTGIAYDDTAVGVQLPQPPHLPKSIAPQRRAWCAQLSPAQGSELR